MLKTHHPAVGRADYREADGWLGVRVSEEFLPLVEGGFVDLVDEAKTLLPGVAVEMSPGHTPGHMSVLVDSEGDQALVIGDMMHHPLQVEHPLWYWEGDVHPEEAVQVRMNTIERPTRSSGILAANHFPQPRFGHVHTAGGTTRFEPSTASTRIS